MALIVFLVHRLQLAVAMVVTLVTTAILADQVAVLAAMQAAL
jgi:hypothetical protein